MKAKRRSGRADNRIAGPQVQAEAPPPRPASDHAGAGLMVVILLVVLFAGLRLLVAELPLERDEGEYAYNGQLLLQGVPPYLGAYNMKWPGTYAAYAAILAVFGQTARAVRLGLIVVTSLTALFVWVAGRRLFGVAGGVAAAGASLLLSFGIGALGPFGHATHFVALFAMAGFALLVSADALRPPAWKLVLAGALIALAAVMKQPGAAFGVAAAAALVFPPKPWTAAVRRVGLLAAGAALALGLTALWLVVTGAFERFWFWTVDYAREYGSLITREESMTQLRRSAGLIFASAPLLWLLAAAGLVLLFVKGAVARQRVMLLAVVLGGLAATMPGFYFRQHYFIVLFPGVALLAGFAVARATQWAAEANQPRILVAVPLLVMAVILAMGIAREWRWVKQDGNLVMRWVYGPNPFPESPVIARYIRDHTRPGDRIAVVGSEPQIYFLAQRRAATGYIYTYPLMEPHKFARSMQKEMIEEITKAKPAYVVAVNVKASWLPYPDSDPTILQWVQQLPARGYAVEGLIEMGRKSFRETWGPEAATATPRTEDFVIVMRRM